MEVPADVRPSPIAGSWYPGDPRRLARSVDDHLAAARLPELMGAVVAVVAPHAGHRYSGPVAGYAFAALRGLAPELVAVVGPLHDLHPHWLLTSGHTAYETPLGTVQVDRDAVGRLEAHLGQDGDTGLARIRNDREHSLEIELPFLQRVLAAPFRLLPLMVRTLRPDALRALGRALARALEGRPTLLVASTDLSHFHSQAEATRLDGEMLRRVEALDPAAVLSAEAEGRGEACGAGALAAVLWAARDLGADRARVLRQATSGDVTGDLDEVVGYGAAVVTRSV
ncbi:MAG: AmmeMemoRadiSam system protein B [Candidatus Rokubacteria bacterium]|nr:AmmeMemoRadiSam system protein B [Candidatus Rokubacteria bacterium]